jgi:chromodomain-helicase-DNA-binding protein 4
MGDQMLQCLTLLAFLKHEGLQTGPHLLVVNAPSHHAQELARHAPDLKIVVLEGNLADQAALLDRLADTPDSFDVLVTTRQDALLAHAKTLMAFAWHAVVLDVDSADSATSTPEELSRFQSRFTLLVTPVPPISEHTCTASQLWSLARFLLPRCFSDDNESELPIEPELLTKLHDALQPFVLRRLIAGLTDLPPLREITLMVGMSDEQRESYRQRLAQFHNATANNAPIDHRLALKTLMGLRIVCNQPSTLTGSPLRLEERSAKIWALSALLQRLHRRGSRVVIAAQMVRTLDALSYLLGRFGFATRRSVGSMPSALRASAMADFNAADSQVFAFLLSARTGGFGLHLTGADTLIICDPETNPENERQLINRVHWRGQTKLVTVVRLITAGSVEEKLAQLAHQRAPSDPELTVRTPP